MYGHSTDRFIVYPPLFYFRLIVTSMYSCIIFNNIAIFLDILLFLSTSIYMFIENMHTLTSAYAILLFSNKQYLWKVSNLNSPQLTEPFHGRISLHLANYNLHRAICSLWFVTAKLLLNFELSHTSCKCYEL